MLIYGRQSQLNIIGNWLYETAENDRMVMDKKYDRYKLFQRIFLEDKSLSASDRILAVDEHVFAEHTKAANTWNELIQMSKGEIACPGHFKFRKSFMSLQPLK